MMKKMADKRAKREGKRHCTGTSDKGNVHGAMCTLNVLYSLENQTLFSEKAKQSKSVDFDHLSACLFADVQCVCVCVLYCNVSVCACLSVFPCSISVGHYVAVMSVISPFLFCSSPFITFWSLFCFSFSSLVCPFCPFSARLAAALQVQY